MPPVEISLTRRVFALRESCADQSTFVHALRSELAFSDTESSTLAAALEDRFLSPEEQINLLGHLEPRSSASTSFNVGEFIQRLSGSDGREASRYHARYLTEGLAAVSVEGDWVSVDDARLRELAAALPHGEVSLEGFSPVTFGMYHYLQPQDTAMLALVSDLRGHWVSSSDPILRMRSARVLALAGDEAAAEFLHESEQSFEASYAGSLSLNERLTRAAGLAVDGNPVAIRFLQDIAMNPRESVLQRCFALSYLAAENFENGSDTMEVFRALVEDPEEPTATRYLMLRLLARAEHAPESTWWRRLIDDPTMILTDRNSLPEGAIENNASSEYSQWHLVLAALGTSHAGFAADLLRQTLQNRGAPLAIRREALMAYLRVGDGVQLSWETLREILALPAGDWDGILREAASGNHALRLSFPYRPAHAMISEIDLGVLDAVDSELVLEFHESRRGLWEVEIRPRDTERDPAVALEEPGPVEASFPRNRRILLGGLSFEEIRNEVLLPALGLEPSSVENVGPSVATLLPGSQNGPSSRVSSGLSQRENSREADYLSGI